MPLLKTQLNKLSRTQAVWLSLVAALTVVGGLLAALSGGTAPRIARAAPAAAVEREATEGAGIDVIFDTKQNLIKDRWASIVVHDSGSPMGSAARLAERDEGRGLRGLGLHFVITNGQGGPDGQIQIGYRWNEQLPGAHVEGLRSRELNEVAIGIALIGDGERRPFTDAQMASLRRLVRSLCERLEIPQDAVMLHRDVAPVRSPGRLFPEAAIFGPR